MPIAQDEPAGAASIVADDELGRADQVGGEHDLVAALGVHEDVDAGHAAAHVGDVLGGEPAVHRAVPAPEDHLRVAQLLGGQAAVGLVRVEDHAVVEREAELEHGGVAAQVLVGQEQHLPSPLRRTPSAAPVSALDEVQTVPPCAPVKPLIAADEFM